MPKPLPPPTPPYQISFLNWWAKLFQSWNDVTSEGDVSLSGKGVTLRKLYSHNGPEDADSYLYSFVKSRLVFQKRRACRFPLELSLVSYLETLRKKQDVDFDVNGGITPQQKITGFDK
ncbi:uncharacterized protein LOC106664745 [Cimex lectularius]|uniref:Uncharacterized protein n=1 Tax=Cimex lectularius TaxID=79782 RepID=A0A8I6RM55_CIMLE|nr:uncharacterized protein LOC106664745 [Cimex lectularius]